MRELFDDGLDDSVREARDRAEASGNICKHCGKAIQWSASSWSGYFHIVSFMTLCEVNHTACAEP